jgi:hypothetical protein
MLTHAASSRPAGLAGLAWPHSSSLPRRLLVVVPPELVPGVEVLVGGALHAVAGARYGVAGVGAWVAAVLLHVVGGLLLHQLGLQVGVGGVGGGGSAMSAKEFSVLCGQARLPEQWQQV